MPDPRERSSPGLPPHLGAEPGLSAGVPAAPSAKCVIESLGVYLPPGIESTREVLHGCADTTWLSGDRAANVERLTGIRSRRVAGDDEGSIDLATKAIAKCLAISTYGPAEVDLLICCSLSRYDRPNQYIFEPSTAVRLRAHFGFDNAMAFDLTNGCAGMFTAIKIAAALIRARLIRVAMVASGEHVTDLMRTAQKELSGRLLSDPRFACLTLGDSGAAVVLTEAVDDRAGFQTIDLYTAAQYSDYSIAKPTDRAHGGLIMFTASVKLFDVAIRHSVAHAAALLRTLQWGHYQPDHVIIHQSGHMAVYEVARQMNELVQREMCHDGNMVDNIGERGNTVTTSHVVAVWDGILSGRIRSGDTVLFSVQGSGLTVGTAPYTFDELPDRVRRAEFGAAPTTSPASRPRRARAASTRVRRVRIESMGLGGDGERGRDGLRLAQSAIDECLAGSAYGKDAVELLIYAGMYRDEFLGEPAMAAMIAARADVNAGGVSADGRRTFAFDMFNGSIGFLNACHVGAGMVRAAEFKTVMIVASEIERDPAIRGAGLGEIAETGSALILDSAADSTVGFGGCVFRTFPEYLGAYRSWLVQEEGRAMVRVERRPDLETVYLECIPPTVAELLRDEGLRAQDIAVVLPPQISAEFARRLAERLQVSPDRFVDVAEPGRDLSSSTLVHSLLAARQRGAVRPGDVGLAVNVGSGVQIGAAIYYF